MHIFADQKQNFKQVFKYLFSFSEIKNVTVSLYTSAAK